MAKKISIKSDSSIDLQYHKQYVYILVYKICFNAVLSALIYNRNFAHCTFDTLAQFVMDYMDG